MVAKQVVRESGGENRVAPTPHHTKEMMDQFVLDLTSEWKALGLPLNPKLGACQPASCAYCRQPAEFARLAARECPLASTGRACPLGELATVAPYPPSCIVY